MQNAAAHLISQTVQRDHITAVLQQLHCFPVNRRVQFKVTRLVWPNADVTFISSLKVLFIWSDWQLTNVLFHAEQWTHTIILQWQKCLLLPVLVYGTICHLQYDHRTSTTISSSVHWKHFCLSLWYPLLPYGTAIEHPVSDRVKPPFVIFDFRALWRSGLSVRVPGCQKLQMVA